MSEVSGYEPCSGDRDLDADQLDPGLALFGIPTLRYEQPGRRYLDEHAREPGQPPATTPEIAAELDALLERLATQPPLEDVPYGPIRSRLGHYGVRGYTFRFDFPLPAEAPDIGQPADQEEV